MIQQYCSCSLELCDTAMTACQFFSALYRLFFNHALAYRWAYLATAETTDPVLGLHLTSTYIDLHPVRVDAINVRRPITQSPMHWPMQYGPSLDQQ
jgi:hypothetical protein